MPLDAVCLLATVREINARTAEGRIDKIYQPERDEIVLSIRLMTVMWLACHLWASVVNFKIYQQLKNQFII